jgi:hypothetical protein
VSADGFLGGGAALIKTIFKRNKEYVTRGGDVVFKNFKLFSDGKHNLLIVNKLEMPGTLHGLKAGDAGYDNLIRMSPADIILNVFVDTAAASIMVGGPLVTGAVSGEVGNQIGNYIFGMR